MPTMNFNENRISNINKPHLSELKLGEYFLYNNSIYILDEIMYGRGYDSYIVIHLGENSAHMEKFDDDIIVNRITIKDINYHIKEM